MQEIWKDIPNYEGFYQVSNLGGLKSLEREVKHSSGCFMVLKEKILRPNKNNRGYLVCTLCKSGKQKKFTIHQLVAITFLNHVICGYKLVVDHINNNPLDNRVENLQLVTQRENISKDKKGGTSKYTGVNWCKKSKKYRSDIRINGKKKFLGCFKNEYEAHLYYQYALICIKEAREIKVKQVKTSSKYKGVGWHKNSKKWQARIDIKGKRKYLGLYNTEIDAHNAYEKELKK